MFRFKRIIIAKIAISALILLSVVNCSKNQNTFLPYVMVNKYISLANFNHLTIAGNSVLFIKEGYKGIIVVCVDPNSDLYYAYDACCPYEKDYSGVVIIQQIKNQAPLPNTIFSSDFFGICNKCGTQFNLMGLGQPVKGPANRGLQRYNVSTAFGSLTVTN